MRFPWILVRAGELGKANFHFSLSNVIFPRARTEIIEAIDLELVNLGSCQTVLFLQCMDLSFLIY